MRQIDAERQAFKEIPGFQFATKLPFLLPQACCPTVEEIYLPATPFSPAIHIDSSEDPEGCVQYASRRPTKAGQLAAAAQARRMAAYARGVEVRGMGFGVGYRGHHKPMTYHNLSAPKNTSTVNNNGSSNNNSNTTNNNSNSGVGGSSNIGGQRGGPLSMGAQALRKNMSRNNPRDLKSMVKDVL